MVKKVLGWLIAAFIIYYVVSAPTEAANSVRQAGEGLQSVVRAILAFFDGLTPSS